MATSQKMWKNMKMKTIDNIANKIKVFFSELRNTYVSQHSNAETGETQEYAIIMDAVGLQSNLM